MSPGVCPIIQQIEPDQTELLTELTAMFAVAFGNDVHYTSHPPGKAYQASLLQSETFIALAALEGGEVVGGLAAYELRKFEQERSEIYLYDLAVKLEHRRRGIASALIARLKEIAAARGAWVVFVQADTGEEDKPAIALYDALGTREEVLHFDFVIGSDRDAGEEKPP